MKHLFETYCSFARTAPDGTSHTTTTRQIDLDAGCHQRVGDVLRQQGVEHAVHVFADENTMRVAGDEVVRALEARDIAYRLALVPDEPIGGCPRCDDATIDWVQARLGEHPVDHALAIGAGTINDLVKMATFRHGISYSVVATAPSMNGYTSAIAAILSEGVKTTRACHAPIYVFADPTVMAESPYRMIASGIGDLYSKPVSNADWRLSHRLLGTPHSAIVMEIVEAGGALLDGVAPLLPARDEVAVSKLSGALMLSGLAMQAAGSSMSASGGEHLISHYIDMTSVAFGLSHDFHGCQVAVGTIATSTLYEHLRSMRPDQIDVEACVAAHPAWDAHQAHLTRRFGPLADAVIEHARTMYPTRETLRDRLRTLVNEWHDIQDDVSKTLRPTIALERELQSADCPTRFAEIDVDAERAYDVIVLSKDIRARYTILHIASELGFLEDFARQYVSLPRG